MTWATTRPSDGDSGGMFFWVGTFLEIVVPIVIALVIVSLVVLVVSTAVLGLVARRRRSP